VPSQIPPSKKVVEAVAVREGVEPTELDTPLNDYIDPNALNILSEAETVRITFVYLDYEVTVRPTGAVEVDQLDDS
jgi:hypothetical protein